MPWIFTYSDLNPQVIESLLERAPFCSLPASLPNYKVVFRGRSRKWGGALATIEKNKKAWTYGSALLLPPEEIRILDKYYSQYEQQELTIFLDATQDKVKAKTYHLSPALPHAAPSEDYIKAILKHLKFFWGQEGSGRVNLENFNIDVSLPPEKKTRRKKSKDKVVGTEDHQDQEIQDQENIEDTQVEEKPEKPEKKPKRRRRAVKKK